MLDKYIIVCATGTHYLCQEVNDRLAEGYMVLGAPLKGDHGYLYQVMILNENSAP